jgi:hypothetical protein
VFFPVPRDAEGTFASYKPGGRTGEWFMSNSYLTYQQGLAATLTATGSSTTTPAAAAAVDVSTVTAESVPQTSLGADERQLPPMVNGAESIKLPAQTHLKDTEALVKDQQAAA